MDGANEHTDADTNASSGSGTDPGDTGSGSGRVLDGTTDGLPRTVLVGGAIAAVGIVMTGVMVNLLDRIGPAGSADVMWIFGYGMTIFALWYLLVRPIDFSERYG